MMHSAICAASRQLPATTARRSPRLAASSRRPAASVRAVADAGLRCLEASAAEEDDEELQAWRSPEPFGGFPDGPTPCPLAPEHPLLTLRYSLSTQSSVDTTVSKRQATALGQIMRDRPASLPPRPLARRQPPGSFSISTIQDRCKIASQFVGFCALVMRMKPTLEHVLDAQVVAKYWGWLKARGVAVSTLRKIMTHLAELAPFVNSKHCPRITQSRRASAEHMMELDGWFTRVIAKLQSEVSQQRHATSSSGGITFTQIWDSLHAEWAAHDKQVVEKGGYGPALVMKLASLLIKSCICCYFQPPLRQGLLRLLHTHAHSDDKVPCCYDGCTQECCSKNRICYIEDDNEDEPSAAIECVHYKYSKVKGPQVIPLSAELGARFADLDHEMSNHFPDSHTLFCTAGRGIPYSMSYFNSLINGKLLRFDDEEVTAVVLRRKFVRAFRDFLSDPATGAALHGRIVERATESAAAMMLNSPGVWDHYDDMGGERSTQLALHLWPRFQAFVREQDAKLQKRRYIDPDTYRRKRQRKE
ncbi:hypothetical protein ABPG75_012853 [Micractinium tetrahymenae]